jgi:hypothetical protein
MGRFCILGSWQSRRLPVPQTFIELSANELEIAGKSYLLPHCGAIVSLFPEVFETQTDSEVPGAQKLYHRLQIISLFSGNSDLLILNLTLDL